MKRKKNKNKQKSTNEKRHSFPSVRWHRGGRLESPGKSSNTQARGGVVGKSSKPAPPPPHPEQSHCGHHVIMCGDRRAKKGVCVCVWVGAEECHEEEEQYIVIENLLPRFQRKRKWRPLFLLVCVSARTNYHRTSRTNKTVTNKSDTNENQ